MPADNPSMSGAIEWMTKAGISTVLLNSGFSVTKDDGSSRPPQPPVYSIVRAS
jgi:hypothetical protein